MRSSRSACGMHYRAAPAQYGWQPFGGRRGKDELSKTTVSNYGAESPLVTELNGKEDFVNGED